MADAKKVDAKFRQVAKFTDDKKAILLVTVRDSKVGGGFEVTASHRPDGAKATVLVRQFFSDKGKALGKFSEVVKLAESAKWQPVVKKVAKSKEFFHAIPMANVAVKKAA